MRKFATCTAIAALACAGSVMADDTLYFSDFASDDGGWVATADWDPVGDWEHGAYDIGCFAGLEGIAPDNSPTGTNVWATNLCDDYTGSGGDNFLTQTFDFSGYDNVTLNWSQWLEVFYTFDTANILVNGDLVYERIITDAGPWEDMSADLSAYGGMSEVEVSFVLHATTVVNKAGWYLDSVEILGSVDVDCLTLGVDNLVAGEVATFTTEGGTPGERGVTVWGTGGAPSVINELQGWCVTFGFDIHLQGRKFLVIGSDLFNDDGIMVVTRKVRNDAGGQTVLFQSAERNTCPSECVSNIAEEVVG